MMRLVLFLIIVLVLATGLAWLADRPGTLLINWQDYVIETSVFRAAVMLAALAAAIVLVWSIMRQIWSSPAVLSHYLTRRRQRRGLDALSSGMIAIGAGDRAMATRYALQARKSLPNEPLTHLLRAQAAQLTGDKATARRIFEAMLATPDTEQLGLRGLFLEAGREGERVAQHQFAERAVKLNPKLSWPVEALFDLECKEGDWAGALETLAIARRHGHIERATGDRRRAVLLTAQAQAVEEANPDTALTLALEAHSLAPDLVPAAAIAGRLLASRGNTSRAAKILQKTWSKAPHPDLATAYAYARIGDSPRDRLDRVKQLAALNPYSIEGPIAVAIAAIEAREYDEARSALAPYLETGLTRRAAALMARIEGEQHGDKGRMREWLARAVNAPRDPAWTADGVVSDRWAPVSPVTGALDAFRWRVPVEELEGSEGGVLHHEFEELVALGAPSQPITASTTAPGAAKLVAARGPIGAEALDAGLAGGPATLRMTGAGAGRSAAAQAPDAAGRQPALETEGRMRASKPPVPELQPAAPAAKITGSAIGGQKRPLEPRPKTEDRAEGAAPNVAQQKSKTKPGRPAEPRIFVPPRAPDDPGAEAAEADEAPSPLGPFRAPS